MPGSCQHEGVRESRCPDCGKRLYTYAHEHPAITSDIAAFTLQRGPPGQSLQLCILLIRRGQDPHKGKWALPGGFLGPKEDIDACARRELEEETGVTSPFMKQLSVVSDPDRDPRQRVVTVPYLAIVPFDKTKLRAGGDAATTEWMPVGPRKKRSALAFDHGKILESALDALREQLKQPHLYRILLPDPFSLAHLKQVHDAIAAAVAAALEQRIAPGDKGNLRKLVHAWQEDKIVRELRNVPAQQGVSQPPRPGPKTRVYFRFTNNAPAP